MKLYDLSRLEEMAEGDKEFIHSILEAFTEEILVDVSKMNEAYELENYTVVRELAHKIKPTLELLGVTELGIDVINVEHWAKESSNIAEMGKGITKIKYITNEIAMEFKKVYNI